MAQHRDPQTNRASTPICPGQSQTQWSSSLRKGPTMPLNSINELYTPVHIIPLHIPDSFFPSTAANWSKHLKNELEKDPWSAPLHGSTVCRFFLDPCPILPPNFVGIHSVVFPETVDPLVRGRLPLPPEPTILSWNREYKKCLTKIKA